MAERQGMQLVKCRRRDPLALGFGTYKLVDDTTGDVVAGHVKRFGLTLDDAERMLEKGGRS